MDETHIYLYPYQFKDINLLKGWNVMISPEGEIFKIYERTKLETGHDLFASTYFANKYKRDINEVWAKYQKTKPVFKSIGYSPKDILIHLFGFLNYEYFAQLEITGPKYNVAGLRVTDKQILIVEELIRLNKDSRKALETLIEEDCKEQKIVL